MRKVAGSGIALIGYRATGKTSVGRLASTRLRRPFADADQVLEQRLGCTIPALFAARGEAVFRDEEEATLATLTERAGLVLSTGGGVILRDANRERLRRFGLIVWLTASADVLAERLNADADGLARRPALTAAGTLDEILMVLAAREPLYRELADITIDTAGRSPEQVCDVLMAAIEGGPRT